MEFKKINENTFECLLSKEDLEDFDMTMEDFLKDQEKTIEFMRKIIERSEEEIDFEPSSGMMSMQIAPLPGDGLSLVFSNRQSLSGMDLLNHVRDLIRSHMEEMTHDHEIDEHEDHAQGDEECGNGLDGASNAGTFMDLTSIMDDVRHRKTAQKEAPTASEYSCLYYFKSFANLEAFCKSWKGARSVKSQILKAEQDGGYYLVIEKGRLSQKTFLKLGETLAEYGEFVTDHPLRITNIREYAKVVITRNAIDIMHDL